MAEWIRRLWTNARSAGSNPAHNPVYIGGGILRWFDFPRLFPFQCLRLALKNGKYTSGELCVYMWFNCFR